MASSNIKRPVVEGSHGALPWAPLTALLLVALPLAALVVVTGTVSGTQQVESGLVEQTQNDLTAAGIRTTGVEVTFDHRDGRISGSLPVGVTHDDVRAAITSEGVRVLDLSGLDGPATLDEMNEFDDSTEPVSVAEPAVSEPEPAPEPAVTTTTLAPEVVTTSTVDTSADTPATTEAPASTTSPTTLPEVAEPGDNGDGSPEVAALQGELDAIEDDIRTDLVFSASSDDLDAAAQEALDPLVQLLEQYPLPVLRITGHTDDRGTEDTNARLSASRAEAVAGYLVSQGISSSRVQFVGAGESDPIADNSTAAGQAQNRRVQFTALEAFE